MLPKALIVRFENMKIRLADAAAEMNRYSVVAYLTRSAL